MIVAPATPRTHAECPGEVGVRFVGDFGELDQMPRTVPWVVQPSPFQSPVTGVSPLSP
ncbi:hypothetical protein K353_01278 [Kitasatospora sp. SolWspMP-SS2h]|nr:hypothetical protein K353_01278 [Kitasatospora sp. SolWspMP-SS2h]